MSGKMKLSMKSATAKNSTADRAELTMNIKFTRGKQLVEHPPEKLIPDPQNPRPGEVIDAKWLHDNLKLSCLDSLCTFNAETKQYYIPEFHELAVTGNEELEDSYSFLRSLAYSLRHDGLIEPIEVFLADRNNDPEYFSNNDLQYAYVILEGHQRRLAAMLAGLSTITCIEITDASMLAKLKIKHRKLRRQLSENNLRKPLTVAQNFEIVAQLLSEPENHSLTNQELAQIISLNPAIAGVLKKICLNKANYPEILLEKIQANELTFKAIRTLITKTHNEIIALLNGKNSQPATPKPKARGRQGGAIKKSATFKIKSSTESASLHKLLISRFPELHLTSTKDCAFKSLEELLQQIMKLATTP